MALFAFWGISTNCVQNVCKILGLDASDGIAEIVLGHDVVPVEHGSGAVTRHAHYHGLWNAKPARPGDEAAAQIVEPDPVEACGFPRPAEGPSMKANTRSAAATATSCGRIFAR